MRAIVRNAFAMGALAMAAQAAAQVTFYEHNGFRGASITIDRPTGNLDRYGFAHRASSAVVAGEAWQFCEGAGFGGRCVVLQPGRYDTLALMNDSIASARPVGAGVGPGYAPPVPVSGQITMFEAQGMRGRSFTVERPVDHLEGMGFNNRASSVEVSGGSWEVCDGSGFTGRCAVLRPGRYPSLNEMGLNNRISSARPVGANTGYHDPYASGRFAGQVTLYEHADFRGQSFTADRALRNLDRQNFNNAASSIVVTDQPWQLCDGPDFSGRCIVLRPGRYSSLGSMGMNDSITSLRPAR